MPDSAPFPGKPAIPSVTELTRQIRESLEGRFSDVWVEGEISNYRPHSSGHHYFTLKDARAQLSCVMFRGQARTLPEAIRDGRLVQARGDISVYEARGQYQLVVRWMQPKGFGELQARFEALKRQLEAEGLFDSGRKRPLPFFPRTVALVTSPTGAAIRDMLNILGRRAPWLRILVWPVRVQGNGASDEIARAINEIKSRPDLGIEVVIVGRGGGSIEDLWSFNEEDVARAISECPVPVISAVGHEIDFTIADFVADLRAPTPSAAAELVTPDGSELRKQIELLIRRLGLRSEQRLGGMAAHLDYHRRSLSTHEPGRVIEDYLQGCDLLKDRLEGISESAIQDRRRDLS
ncbi:MAG: exodeoxyribonuclease VII large subunit, partial [Verrucomicrobiae bacterium]|nr:exodeoxyribonuclease VII large subunit [Verrucomicrobiae bacterium]